MKTNRRQMLQLALLGAAPGLAFADTPIFRRAGLAFDTGVALTIAGLERKPAEAALDAGFAEIRRLERIAGLSTPGSDIRRLNEHGVLREPDPALLDMLQVAADMHHASAGAFDVTVQPLWIFYDAHAKRGLWPTEAEAAPVRALIGLDKVRFNPDEIRFETKGMGLTLNSLTHGYAADRVAKIFAERGVTQAFIDTGEMEALGKKPENRDWTIAVKHPRDPDAILGTAPVTGCMATAGDYAYAWSDDFTRHHILDPRSGYSPAHFSSVTVIAARALVADALSTTIAVVGPQEGRALLQRFNAEAYGVAKTGAIWATAGFPRQNLA